MSYIHEQEILHHITILPHRPNDDSPGQTYPCGQRIHSLAEEEPAS